MSSFLKLKSTACWACVPALVALAASSATACTGIRLKAEDGSVVCARTLEFGVDLDSSLLVIPRHYALAGTTNSGRPGLRWESKYAAVGMNGAGQTIIADGLNEKGLAAGIFYMPSYAGYQAVGPDDVARSIAPWEVVTWALTNFATVAEVTNAIGQIKVGSVFFPAWDLVPPLHYIVHDADGNSLVIEYIDGELKLHENPLGVIANSPSFDWHLTNLRNYVNLSPLNVPPVSVDGLKLGALGQGSGTLGLPGDFTPPSRFVRAAAFSQTSVPGHTGLETVQQAFHVLDSFDISPGSVRGGEKDTAAFEHTQWTTASDMKSRTFYFHTSGNRRVRRFELLNADLDAAKPLTIRVENSEDVQDVSAG